MVCLQLTELECLAGGSVASDDRARMDEHLSSCEVCRDRLEDISANLGIVDPVRRALKRASLNRQAPKVIDQYEILHEIGRGGMGVVYAARQASPRRFVAVKQLSHASPSDQSAQRFFLREANALARVQHPGIAAIYDAGISDDNRWYIVMEFVQGESLIQYAAQRGLDLQERLHLFIRICDAVTAAHRRGVIHRDLKPSNILVVDERESPESDRLPTTSAERSGSPIQRIGQPKILDFGLAKITSQHDDQPASLATEAGRVLGTLQYMSPEQARGDVEAADVRSDVYALGVVLYELLTEQLPYELPRHNLPEAIQIICNQTPSRPSGLNRMLRGDLETIILKSLEKAPERRYENATALRDDLNRYLTRQPIMARSPTLRYQLGKMISRHKISFAFSSTALIVFVTFAIVTALLAARLAEEQSVTQQAAQLEADARREAERQRSIAQAVNAFIIDILGSADPWRGGNTRDRRVIDALADSASLARERFPDQPDIEAEILFTIGNTYRSLGEYAEAEAMLRQALEIQEALHAGAHLSTAQTLNKLARVRQDRGDYDEAEQLFRDALAMRMALLGAQHAETAIILNNLGWLLFQQGEYDDAEQITRQALDIRREQLGEHDSEIATSLNNLAGMLARRGQLEDAETMYRESLAIDRIARGEDHPNIASTMNNLALVIRAQGRINEALAMLRDVQDRRFRLLGDRHPHTAQGLLNLAVVLRQANEVAEARAFAEQAEATYRTIHDEQPHPDIARSIHVRSQICHDLGEMDEAEELCRAALDMRRQLLGVDHPDTATTMLQLGLICLDRNLLDEGEHHLRQARQVFIDRYGAKHAAVVRADELLARAQQARQ